MKEKIVYDGEYVKIKEQKIENTVWEKIYLHGGIVVYPFNSEGKLLLVSTEPRIPYDPIIEKVNSIYSKLNSSNFISMTEQFSDGAINIGN